MPKHQFCVQCGARLQPFEEEGRTRLRCAQQSPPCGWTHYGNPTPVVAAIVELDGHVVLARNVGWPDGMFGLVTGFLEAGETPEAGVLREVKEELGLAASVVELIGAYAFEQRNELIVAYHVVAQGEPVVGAELAGIKRVPIEKLRPWPFGTGAAVAEWLQKRRARA